MKKYKKSLVPLRSLDDIPWALRNNYLLFIDNDSWKTKVRHPSVIMNMALIVVKQMLDLKRIYLAEKI